MTKEEVALYEKLRLPISELELSVRSSNCLREAGIKVIADLVKKTEDEMFRGIVFKGANLSNADVNHIDFTGSDFSGAILDGARKDNAKGLPGK